MGLPNVPDWKPSLVITAIPVGGRCVFLDLQVYMHIRSKPTRTDMFWWFVQGLLQVNHYIYKHMYHCFLVWKNLSISREKTRGKRLPPQRLPCPKVHDRKGHNLGLGERRGRDGPGQGGSRSPGDVGRVGFNRNASERRCFFLYKSWDDVLNLGISWFFGDDILETKNKENHIMRVSKRSFSGKNVFEWSIWQPSGHRRTDGQVLCHSVLVGLAFGTERFGAAQLSQIFANLCPISAYLSHSFCILCSCVSLCVGSIPPNILFMFLFHAHVTPVSKCIANCLPFKVSLSYHLNFKQAPELHRLRICSKFSPWKQLTGRMSEFF